MVKSYFILLAVFSISFVSIPCNAQTASTTSQEASQATNTNVESTSGGLIEAQDTKKEEKKEDPMQNFKLVAIYLIGGQPRALIKDLSKPEEGAKEFKIGEFLDELQTYSISKIAFNPTGRIEIIDENGLSYLIKPYNVDVKNLGSTPKTTFTNKSTPSYFSGSKSKSKKNASRDSEAAASDKKQVPPVDAAAKDIQATDSKPASQTPPTSQTSSTSQQSGTTSQTLQAVAPAQPGDSAQAQTQKPSQPAGASTTTPPTPGDSLDVSRPSNPFQQ